MASGIERSVMIERLARLTEEFAMHVPHNKALGMGMVSCEDGAALMYLDWRDDLVGDPLTESLHGGVVSALLDGVAGAAVFMKLPKPQAIATLDLRIDFLAASVPRERLFARAECYHMTREVAFVRGLAYHEIDGEKQPVASASGSFVVGTRAEEKAQVQDGAESHA